MPSEKGRHCNRSIVFGGWAEAAFWRVRAPARECRHVLRAVTKTRTGCTFSPTSLRESLPFKGAARSFLLSFFSSSSHFKFYFLLV